MNDREGSDLRGGQGRNLGPDPENVWSGGQNNRRHSMEQEDCQNIPTAEEAVTANSNVQENASHQEEQGRSAPTDNNFSNDDNCVILTEDILKNDVVFSHPNFFSDMEHYRNNHFMGNNNLMANSSLMAKSSLIGVVDLLSNNNNKLEDTDILATNTTNGVSSRRSPYQMPDDDDLTEYRADQAHWSADNLPDIIYVLQPTDEHRTTKRGISNVPVKSYQIWGKTLRDIPCLPDRISSRLEDWRAEAWFRMDQRIGMRDIIDRVNPRHRHRMEGKHALQSRTFRFRENSDLLGWTKSGKFAEKEAKLHAKLRMAGIDPVLNSTRGSTPGLINPLLGEDGGRILYPQAAATFPDTVYQQPWNGRKVGPASDAENGNIPSPGARERGIPELVTDAADSERYSRKRKSSAIESDDEETSASARRNEAKARFLRRKTEANASRSEQASAQGPSGKHPSSASLVAQGEFADVASFGLHANPATRASTACPWDLPFQASLAPSSISVDRHPRKELPSMHQTHPNLWSSGRTAGPFPPLAPATTSNTRRTSGGRSSLSRQMLASGRSSGYVTTLLQDRSRVYLSDDQYIYQRQRMGFSGLPSGTHSFNNPRSGLADTVSDDQDQDLRDDQWLRDKLTKWVSDGGDNHPRASTPTVSGRPREESGAWTGSLDPGVTSLSEDLGISPMAAEFPASQPSAASVHQHTTNALSQEAQQRHAATQIGGNGSVQSPGNGTPRAQRHIIWTLHRRLEIGNIWSLDSTINPIDVFYSLVYFNWDIDQAEIYFRTIFGRS